MIYCTSDIHGDYNKYTKMLELLKLTDEDTLYVIGDVVDRGRQSMKILQDMMLQYNVIPIMGNHEYAAMEVLSALSKEITDDNLELFDENLLQKMLHWCGDGGSATLEEFKALSKNERRDIIEYLSEFSLYEEITVNDTDYILVHAGLMNFTPDRPMEDYELYELLFERINYNKQYFKDKIIVTGHTPTRNILDNDKPDYIYKRNNHIAIDCGCGYGGKLGAICLDTGEEFYC